jgi:hypothetical protein
MPNEPSARPEDLSYLASSKSFLLEAPLYHPFDLSGENIAKLVFQFLTSLTKVDVYCIYCAKDSVFSPQPDLFFRELVDGRYMRPYDVWRVQSQGAQGAFYIHQLSCTRTDHGTYVAFFLMEGGHIQKIGQHPSVADFQIPYAARYRKILGEERYKEFTKGLGLAAHGVGIGSFVYLRRIFENLIEEAHTAAQHDTVFSEDKYKGARMDEKIEQIRGHLPPFLVKNKSIYGILSQGIHELTERECLSYFEPLRVGIELILDEQIERVEKKRKALLAEAAIQKINQQIKS